MSEGKECRDKTSTANGGEVEGRIAVPPMVNEDKGEVAVSPMVNEGEGKAVTTPIVDEGQGMDRISPVMSYEPGTDDYLEPFTSEGETRYEGKGKNRAESFSHLPSPRQSTPSTAPSTRPTSQAQDESAPSTAPTTRPVSQTQDDPSTSTASTTERVSQAQADPEPDMADNTSFATEEKGDSAAITSQSDSDPIAGQSNPAPAFSQGDSAAIAAQDETPRQKAQSDSGSNEPQDNLPPKNISVKYDCGCRDIYDDTGKKRQQACAQHKLKPIRSELLSPPKKPLGESTNLPGETRDLSVYTPQASHNQDSPPRQPPVVTPTKGRNFVQELENGPVFLDPFNSERAIEPTGPPNTLTTIPTQEDVPLKQKSSGGVSNPKESTPKVSDPVTARNMPDTTQAHEGASGSQTKQQQKFDAVELKDLGSRLPMDDQRTGEKAAAEPRRVEVSEGEGTPLSDEDHLVFTGREVKKPLVPLNSPHHRQDIRPRSILKKPVDTTAAAGQAERGMAYSGQVNSDEDSEDKDNSQGIKLFQATLAKFKAGGSNKATNNDSSPPIREEQGGVPTLRLGLETRPDPAASPSPGDSDDDILERAKKFCPKCPGM